MHRTALTPERQLFENSEATRRLRGQGGAISSVLRGAHQPTEGGYLEHLVREALREHVPNRFSVSTGFVVGVETNEVGDWERAVSPQYDVLVWDSTEVPPLFEVGELAVVAPSSCVAVVEVTRRLTKKKLLGDLWKLDELSDFYFSPDHPVPFPYTGVLAFEGGVSLTKTLEHLEVFYHQSSTRPAPWRYDHARRFRRSGDTRELPGFVNGICVLDQGLLRGLPSYDGWMEPALRVLYEAYSHDEEVEDAFGLFRRDIIRWLTARAQGKDPASADLPRSFGFNPYRAPTSRVWIEDWSHLVPCRNVSEWASSARRSSPTNYQSAFIGVDHTASNGFMYREQAYGAGWAIEFVGADTWAAGAWTESGRRGEWTAVRRREGGFASCRFRVDDGTITSAERERGDRTVLGDEGEFADVVIRMFDE